MFSGIESHQQQQTNILQQKFDILAITVTHVALIN